MNEEFDPATFEFLIHILEFSVVIGIGVIIYINLNHSKKINKDIEKRLEDEMDIPPNE